jgi:hypothetical protein
VQKLSQEAERSFGLLSLVTALIKKGRFVEQKIGFLTSVKGGNKMEQEKKIW